MGQLEMAMDIHSFIKTDWSRVGLCVDCWDITAPSDMMFPKRARRLMPRETQNAARVMYNLQKEL